MFVLAFFIVNDNEKRQIINQSIDKSVTCFETMLQREENNTEH